MVNLIALNNMTPLSINTTLIENQNSIIPNLIANTNTQTDNWWGLMVMASIFFYLLWNLQKESGMFKLDFIKSLVYSSGISLIIGIVMIVSDITTTFNHIIWFGIIFTFAIISTWYLKQKGL